MAHYNISQDKENYQHDDIIKDLVASSVEKILARSGMHLYEKVHRLYKKYYCNLDSCYEHPKYLRETLEELFPNESIVILQSIVKDLKDSYGAQKFLMKLHE